LLGPRENPSNGQTAGKAKSCCGLWRSNIQAIGLKGSGRVNCQQMKNPQNVGYHCPACYLQACRRDIWTPGHVKGFPRIPGHGEQQDFHLFPLFPKRSSGNQQPRNVQLHAKKIKSWVCACHYLHPEGG